ncbi:MAG TPA: glycosyltransferase, partial [Cytophagaceae bacterium]|nr:glycosyltransferase [Cytophagaceae bacterium]
MKVLFVFGGLPHYLIPLLNKLNNVVGLEIIVAIPEERSKTLGSGVYETGKDISFKVVRLKEFKSYYGKPALKGLSRLIRSERPDAMVLGWPYVLALLFYPVLFFTCKKNKVKLINRDIPFNVPKYSEAWQYYKSNSMELEHDDEQKKENGFFTSLKYAFVTLSRKCYFNMVDAHVFYSPIGIETYESYGVKRKDMFVTYNSLDTDTLLKINEQITLEPSILAPNAHRLIHVGRLVKWKKVDMLIEAFAKLKVKFSDAELVIVGDGPELVYLKKLAKDLNVEQDVLFIGAIYDSMLLGRYLQCSSIYVLAGMGGLSINEAMCFGKPIVCSIADGTERDLVIEGKNGRYFKRGNAEDLYKKLDELLSHPDLVKQYGEYSLSIIRNKINLHTVVEGFLTAFNTITE